ncbi:MAG: glycosyltransferase family 2 protein [Phycisphaerales bacterium]|nr:glycosyltransferase family 2 protein [Phycisphaerales bacterium]
MLILVSILLALGLLFWVVQSLLLLLTLRVLPSLQGCRRVTRTDDPLVSVIIPARNEQSVVEAAIRSRLEDPDPHLEFILIDDRSTDSTGLIFDHLASTDPRVQVVHVEELPEQWLGKVHAMQVGMQRARGEWVLLSDADVHVAPGTVREAVDLARSLEVVHLAGIPAIRSRSLGLQLCLAPLQRVLILLVRLWAVRDPGSNAAMGVGAFNLVRRDVFEAAGGCEALRMEVIDDVGVGVMIKKHGGGSCTAFAASCLHISWYDRFSDFISGIERGMAKRPSWCPRWLLALLVLIVAGLDLSPFIALSVGVLSTPIGWIGIGFSAWAVLLSGLVARRFGTSVAMAVMVPLNTILATLVALRVVLGGGRGGQIQWRGNTYEVADLQRGAMVLFTSVDDRNATGEGP